MRDKRVVALQLRMLRINAGLSKSALGDKVGLSHNTITRLEEGETPSVATAFKVATEFGMKPLDIWPELANDPVKANVSEEAA